MDLEGRPASGDKFLRRLDLLFTSLVDAVNECLRPLANGMDGAVNATSVEVAMGAIELLAVVLAWLVRTAS